MNKTNNFPGMVHGVPFVRVSCLTYKENYDDDAKHGQKNCEN